jgi:hypothetical protein
MWLVTGASAGKVVRLHALRINSSKAVKLLLRNKRGKGA